MAVALSWFCQKAEGTSVLAEAFGVRGPCGINIGSREGPSEAEDVVPPSPHQQACALAGHLHWRIFLLYVLDRQILAMSIAPLNTSKSLVHADELGDGSRTLDSDSQDLRIDYCTRCPVFLDTETVQRKPPVYCIDVAYVKRLLGLGGDDLCEPCQQMGRPNRSVDERPG